MRAFHCGNCQQLVFFENVACVRCGHLLAFLPDRLELAALEPVDEKVWRPILPGQPTGEYRLCENYQNHQSCNWTIPAKLSDRLCRSCNLSRLLPDLSVPANQQAWRKLEAAKRRLLYSILYLNLPLPNRQEDPQNGLAFDFLSDTPGLAHEPVLTGHSCGIITINIAEADDAERERRRLDLREPYRTLLGHLRHESGHYYWNLIAGNPIHLESFRAIFGDERADYAASLRHHYEAGPPTDWSNYFISAYASMHPWEDWAETWAHYLHMTDALETAAASGLAITTFDKTSTFSITAESRDHFFSAPFAKITEHWLELTYVLNNLNRSLGLPDGYPFVLPQPAIDKLRFTHELIQSLHFTAKNL